MLASKEGYRFISKLYSDYREWINNTYTFDILEHIQKEYNAVKKLIGECEQKE